MRSLDVFVEGISASRGRRHADETDEFGSDRRRDVNVERVQWIAEQAAIVQGMLRQFRRVNIVSDLIDRPAFPLRCQADCDFAGTAEVG